MRRIKRTRTDQETKGNADQDLDQDQSRVTNTVGDQNRRTGIVKDQDIDHVQDLETDSARLAVFGREI